MKEKELKELKLTKNIIIPFPNFQQNTNNISYTNE